MRLLRILRIAKITRAVRIIRWGMDFASRNLCQCLPGPGLSNPDQAGEVREGSQVAALLHRKNPQGHGALD